MTRITASLITYTFENRKKFHYLGVQTCRQATFLPLPLLPAICSARAAFSQASIESNSAVTQVPAVSPDTMNQAIRMTFIGISPVVE